MSLNLQTLTVAPTQGEIPKIDVRHDSKAPLGRGGYRRARSIANAGVASSWPGKAKARSALLAMVCATLSMAMSKSWIAGRCIEGKSSTSGINLNQYRAGLACGLLRITLPGSAHCACKALLASSARGTTLAS
eukprot:CAMPEP_0204314796 /NCGR_PEP_ID=MMETSP0469-20131031/4444_1 /ASSEMBLY_ACC=CAM_ASM_000384 /TAXON_ID=2969 /ORGANISM="Oxyrrhis marina" /LENGTH=132 /DNA_ID=CAMNT_0051295345 /DNA_START=179 /DNA_END=578 /DNA_ORIENTATION=+